MVRGGGKEGSGYAEPEGGTQSFRVPNLMSQKAAFPHLSVNLEAASGL